MHPVAGRLKLFLCNSSVTAVGKTSGAMTIGGLSTTNSGSTDAFIVQYSSAGAPSWVVTIGGTGADSATGVAYDTSGDVYVTGTFAGTVTVGATSLASAGGLDAYLVKISSTGSVVWIRYVIGGYAVLFVACVHGDIG